MKLVWYGGSHPNFGDDLNEVMWPRLAPELFDDDSRTGFLGIGTIIGRPVENIDHLHVFSSGVGYDNLDKWTVPRTIWCVRGPLSAQLLKEPPDAALTDGAILAPEALGIVPGQSERRGVGLVPHWESELHGGWSEAAGLAGQELISPMAPPLTVFNAINRKALIITESLHGAIVADALGVPWLAIGTSGNVSIFKWTDWALSVGVALRLHPVPSPSGRTIARYGRFAGRSGGGAPVEASAGAAIDHFYGPQPRPSRAGARELLRPIKKQILETRLPAALAGFSPTAMARALTRVAALEPQLSKASSRERLRDQMMSRFENLRRLAANQQKTA